MGVNRGWARSLPSRRSEPQRPSWLVGRIEARESLEAAPQVVSGTDSDPVVQWCKIDCDRDSQDSHCDGCRQRSWRLRAPTQHSTYATGHIGYRKLAVDGEFHNERESARAVDTRGCHRELRRKFGAPVP